MRFAWFILIYCFLAKATGVRSLTTSSDSNQTEIVIVIPADNRESGPNRTNDSDTRTPSSTSSTNFPLNSTSQPTHSADPASRAKQSRLSSSDDVLAAQPSTATLTTLPAAQVKYNRNREIRTDIVHKSIPIQVKE